MTLIRRVLFAVGLCLIVSAEGCASKDIGTSQSESDVQASPFWKNTLSLPSDPFVVRSSSDQPRWVKFTVLLSEPTKVYFQDSNKYEFHYDFAKNHLPGFSQTTAEEFGHVTLAAQGQKLVTGAVLLPPRFETEEYGVQLIRADAYPKEQVKQLFDLVKSAIVPAAGTAPRAFYMPTYEQSASAEADRAWLEQHEVPVGSPTRWLSGDACYSAGWAFGRVVHIPSAEIRAAYTDGRLKYDDILLTDGIPSEAPYVAGIISLTPSVPNSHVAILANSFQVPFVYPATEKKRALVQSLVGKEILLRAETSPLDGSEGCDARVHEIKGTVDAATRVELTALKRPAPLAIASKGHFGEYTKRAETLRPSDVKFFGGKAANFGTIRRTTPNNAREGLGISFDLWDSFLAQQLPTGKTLKQEIDGRLSGITYPPDMAQLAARLEDIRKLIEDVAKFSAEDKVKIVDALKAFPFDPKVKIRFRSSTNIEDSNAFTGAGLYESFSGCLADDTDADESGPSTCDATEAKERGVFRAIRKVYASFYGDNAVFERLKYRVDENAVGMAVLAHYSFPDENEAANGVATVRLQSSSSNMDLVTQLGAESVTNPSGTTLPEVVRTFSIGDMTAISFVRSSSLVTIGRKVMTWESDYQAFVKLIEKVSRAFIVDQGLSLDDDHVLDVEYKKLLTGELIMKQVRLVPRRDRTPSIVPVLLNDGPRLCTFQGEYGSELGNHRLKARVDLHARSAKLSPELVGSSLYTDAQLDLVEGGSIVRKTGPFTLLPGFAHTSFAEPNRQLTTTRDTWNSTGTSFALETRLRDKVSPADSPAFVVEDTSIQLQAAYSTPQPALTFQGPATTSEDSVLLVPCAEDNVASQLETLELHGPAGLVVKTEFHYRALPQPLPTAGYTAPLGKWVKTEISGLTTAPIVLTDYFAQSFRPQHHNFTENFVFEPGLDRTLTAAQRSELDAKDIQLLVIRGATHGSTDAHFWALKKSTQQLEELK